MVTTGLDDAVATALARLSRRGAALLVVLVTPAGQAGAEADPDPTLPTVSVPYDPDWAQRDELVLAR